MNDFVVVMVTSPDREEAGKIARTLLEKRQAACVSIHPRGESLFWWEGRIDRAEEFLLIAKTSRARLEGLTATVREIHGYKVPEIVALPLVGGSREYLEWLAGEVSR